MVHRSKLLDLCIKFEIDFWLEREPDPYKYAQTLPEDERLNAERQLAELKAKLSDLHLDLIVRFQKDADSWTTQDRKQFFNSIAQSNSFDLPPIPADGDSSLRDRLSRLTHIRVEGIVGSLARNDIEVRLKQTGRVPTPQEILRRFAGLGDVTPIYREGCKLLRANQWRYVRKSKKLGEGNTAIIYRARDTELGRDVAMKRLKDSAPEKWGRFIDHEARTIARLAHPSIPVVFGVGRDGDRPFFLMEVLPDRRFEDEINDFHERRRFASQRSIHRRNESFHRLLRRFISVCNVVAYAHSYNVCHRDIKPRNILCDAYEQTYVIDWGFAWNWQERDAAEGYRAGTPDYEAPMADDMGAIATAVPGDVYSLGATLYHMIAGRSPFNNVGTKHVYRALKTLALTPLGPDERELVDKAMEERGDNMLVAGVRGSVVDSAGIADQVQQLKRLLLRELRFPAPEPRRAAVDPELQSICAKAMAYHPVRRYESAAALAQRLDRWLADSADPEYARWPIRHPLIWYRRNPKIHKTLRRTMSITLLVLIVIAVYKLDVVDPLTVKKWVSDVQVRLAELLRNR